jgi:hypothetical protein
LLQDQGDLMDLGGDDEQIPLKELTVEVWGR